MVIVGINLISSKLFPSRRAESLHVLAREPAPIATLSFFRTNPPPPPSRGADLPPPILVCLLRTQNSFPARGLRERRECFTLQAVSRADGDLIKRGAIAAVCVSRSVSRSVRAGGIGSCLFSCTTSCCRLLGSTAVPATEHRPRHHGPWDDHLCWRGWRDAGVERSRHAKERGESSCESTANNRQPKKLPTAEKLPNRATAARSS